MVKEKETKIPEVNRYLSHEDLMELQAIVGDYSKLINFIEARCKDTANKAFAEGNELGYAEGWRDSFYNRG